MLSCFRYFWVVSASFVLEGGWNKRSVMAEPKSKKNTVSGQKLSSDDLNFLTRKFNELDREKFSKHINNGVDPVEARARVLQSKDDKKALLQLAAVNTNLKKQPTLPPRPSDTRAINSLSSQGKTWREWRSFDKRRFDT